MKKNYEKFLPSYIFDIQEINNLSKVMFMNNFPHHQFILCTSGTGKICTENNIEQTVSKGDIVFINSSILFSLRQQENFSIKRIAFNGNFVTNYLQYFDFNPAVVFVPKSNEVFNAFNIAYDGYMHDKDDIQNSVNMYNLIGVCGESYVSSKPTLLTPEDFIAESGFDFIKQNISSINIDFSPYLKLHKISITELNDIFISRYGKNINELIYFYRMEFAKYAVFKVGNTHYERYYNQCGFKSPQEFYSEFKKYANMTVEEYLEPRLGKIIGCRQKTDSLLFYLFSILYNIVAASARFILLFGSIVLSS